MKRVVLGLLLALFGLVAQAQTNGGKNIAVMAVTPTAAEGIPAGAESALRGKVSQLTTSGGLGSMNAFAQFCLAVTVDVASKDVVAGAPVKISETLNFNFYVVDQFDKKVFATTTVSAKGIGGSEGQAYVQAIKTLPVKSPALQNFVKDAREKIIAYYDENITVIIAKAYSLAKLERYDEALFHLGQVPEAVGENYMHVVAATSEIYDLYLDRKCSDNLAKAKAIWHASQDRDGAMAAGVFLAEISPEARCFPDAQALFTEIKIGVREDKEFERTWMIKKWDDTVRLEEQSIEAARQVGIAWGENQQPLTVHSLLGL